MQRILSLLKDTNKPQQVSFYQYRPIEKERDIRVVSVHPAKRLKDPIKCHLSCVSLDGSDVEVGIDYTALSYSWDAQRPSQPIAADDGLFLVTPNCESAIRRLRDTTNVVTLWIDSICINQSLDAVEERNIQVALMGEIYKCAKRVVVWLGESNPMKEKAMKSIKYISSQGSNGKMEEEGELMMGRAREVRRGPFAPVGDFCLHWILIDKFPQEVPDLQTTR